MEKDGPQPGKRTIERAQRADRFVYDVLRHLFGEKIAKSLGTVMRELTDAEARRKLRHLRRVGGRLART